MTSAKPSKMSQTEVTFHDTLRSGGITIEGFEMISDEDFCIECPPAFTDKLAPHGFVRKERDQAKIDNDLFDIAVKDAQDAQAVKDAEAEAKRADLRNKAAKAVAENAARAEAIRKQAAVKAAAAAKTATA